MPNNFGGQSSPDLALATSKCALYNPIDDAEFNKGDFILVSSDHIRFRARSCDIHSMSNVFHEAAGMVSSAEGRLVEFTDQEFETSSVIRRFLEMITSLKFNMDGLPDLPNILKFLDKYECPKLMKILKSSLLECDDRYRMDIFLLGCQLDNVDIAVCAFGEDGGVNQPKNVETLATSFATSYELFTSVPLRYSWAMIATKHKVPRTGGLRLFDPGPPIDASRAFRSAMEQTTSI